MNDRAIVCMSKTRSVTLDTEPRRMTHDSDGSHVTVPPSFIRAIRAADPSQSIDPLRGVGSSMHAPGNQMDIDAHPVYPPGLEVGRVGSVGIDEDTGPPPSFDTPAPGPPDLATVLSHLLDTKLGAVTRELERIAAIVDNRTPHFPRAGPLAHVLTIHSRA